MNQALFSGMLWHYLFDALAFLTSSMVFRFQLRVRQSEFSPLLERRTYWTALVVGALAGAYFFGSLNLSLAGRFAIGHSIAGALAGGIFAVEIYKLKIGYSASTGAVFALPLSAGIAVGRLGCFSAGLVDQTYGLPTDLPWGVDFGDHVLRHPVQLYESGAIAICALTLALWQKRTAASYKKSAFYFFILFYGLQRFAWEFLKPYPRLVGPFNIFHLICAAMVLYGGWMLKGSAFADDADASRAKN